MAMAGHEPRGQRRREQQQAPHHLRVGVQQRAGTGHQEQPDAHHDPDAERLVALDVQRPRHPGCDGGDQRGDPDDGRQPLRLGRPDHRERRGGREGRRGHHAVRAEPPDRQHAEEGGEAEQPDGQPALVAVQPADPRPEPPGQRRHRDGDREPGDRERRRAAPAPTPPRRGRPRAGVRRRPRPARRRCGCRASASDDPATSAVPSRLCRVGANWRPALAAYSRATSSTDASGGTTRSRAPEGPCTVSATVPWASRLPPSIVTTAFIRARAGPAHRRFVGPRETSSPIRGHTYHRTDRTRVDEGVL